MIGQQEFERLGTEIARHLGWTATGNVNGVMLTSGDMSLHLWEPHNKRGHIEVRPHYPDEREVSVAGENKVPPIYVNASRAPAAIAADITRRLLPRYSEAVKRHLEDVRSYRDNAQANEDTAGQLAAILGTGTSLSFPRGSMRVWDRGQRVEMTLSVPKDLAVRIASTIVAYRRTET